MNLLKTYILLILCLLSLGSVSIAQKIQITEKESQLQGLFIEANKEYVLGRYDQAAKILADVIKENETIAAAHFELAKVLEAKGDDLGAINSLNRASNLDKSNKWYLIHKRKLLDKMNSHFEAAQVAQALITLEPNNPQHYYDMAFHYLQADKPKEALNALEKLETIQGPQIQIAEKKIMIYQALGESENVFATINKLVTTSPDNVRALELLAAYYAGTNKPAEATETYKKILAVDPSNVNAKIALAAGLRVAGKDTEFIKSLKELFVNKNVPFDQKMKELVPFIEKISQKKDKELAAEVIEALKLLDQTNPNNAKTYAAMGDIYQNNDDIKGAIQMYTKALSIDKSVFSVWEQLLYLQNQTRDYVSLLKTANELLDIFPNLSSAFYWHALANNKNNKPQIAINSCNQGLLAARKSPANQYKLQIELGTAYALMNDMQKCEEAFNAAIQLNPNAEWAYYSFATALSKLKPGIPKANEMADNALKLAPDNVETLSSKGFVLANAGKYKDAQAFYEKALEKGGNQYPQILEEYGDVMYKQQDLAAADKYWNMSLQLGYPNEALSKKINAKKL